uniref:Zinc finger and BTB domain containing 32 n=1 Tax=Mastacembelus armatus TaxID=205130 RepID=A0A3Q3MSG2_9TELE
SDCVKMTTSQASGSFDIQPQSFHPCNLHLTCRIPADILRRSGSLCDAIISVKSQTFRAHRLVLACASRRLAQQLAQGDTDSPVHCTLEYFSPRTFQQVLDFTYTQALEVSIDDLHLLLRAAQLLEMQPLEDQCRKQLDTLECRARKEDKRREMRDVKEEKERAEETHQESKQSQEKKRQVTSSPVVEARNSTVMPLSPPDPTKKHNSQPSPRKKSRLSPMPETPDNRDSVISRPATNTSFSPPWPFSNTWNSVNTLRRIAENYSNLIAGNPLQSPNQSPMVYPFSRSPTHMFPILAPHFQNPKFNCNVQKLFFAKSHHGTVHYFTPSPVLCHSAVWTGDNCAGCQFCGGEDMVQHDAQAHQQDHRGEKPYQCQHCPKKFSLKHQLDTHHRVHTGEKPFECRLCGQRSRDYSAMIKHLRTHGGAAPYQCTVCLEFCSSLVAMQRHVKSHAVQDFPPDWSINSTYLYTSHI